MDQKIKSGITRGAIVAACLCAWFWTQSLLGQRTLPAGEIVDVIHAATAPLHDFLSARPSWVNGLLIATSFCIDLFGVSLLVWSIIGPSFRPFLGLMFIFALRQICQGLTALPLPSQPLWHDPGFPSLLVTYGVSSDLFFSGHTAIAVFGAIELARFQKKFLTLAGIVIAALEIATVLILRMHYMMDVFAGIVTALWVASWVKCFSEPIDRWLGLKNKGDEFHGR